MRREVLRVNDLAAERRKAREAERLVDDKGALLPSNEKVAGVVLPRGYKPRFNLPREWYLDGEHQFGKLVTYFTEQLDADTVTRPNKATLTFLRARTKGDPNMEPVSVTISPVPGRDDWSRIHIVAPPPAARKSGGNQVPEVEGAATHACLARSTQGLCGLRSAARKSGAGGGGSGNARLPGALDTGIMWPKICGLRSNRLVGYAPARPVAPSTLDNWQHVRRSYSPRHSQP
jgi:hypothetical protein